MMRIWSVLFFFMLSELHVLSQDLAVENKKKSDLTAEEIVARYLENIGGEDHWLKIQSITFVGSIQQGEMNFVATIYYMPPHRNKIVADAMGKSFIDCTDGDQAWFFNPFMGMEKPQRKSRQQMKMAYNEFENPFIRYKEKGSKVELLGVQEVRGTLTYEVRLEEADGQEYFYFFDTEYLVPIMMKTFVDLEEPGEQSMETYFSDYEEVGAVVIPHTIEHRLNDLTFMQMTADTIILNDPAVTAELFAFPEEKAKKE